MKAHDLAQELLKGPNEDVMTDDGLVVGTVRSNYDTAEASNIPCVILEVGDD